MTSAENPQDPGQPDRPGDVPAERPASLARLDVLIGEWEMAASFADNYSAPGSPAVTERGGRTTFEWLDGKFFLIQRVTVDHPPAPDSITIIGTGGVPEIFAQHYYDSRGVTRVYQMSLDDGIWKLWREAPGFWQRYTGVFSADGMMIEGAWERSADGSQWQHDFRLAYIRT